MRPGGAGATRFLPKSEFPPPLRKPWPLAAFGICPQPLRNVNNRGRFCFLHLTLFHQSIRNSTIMADSLSSSVNSLQSSLQLLDSSISTLDSGINDFPRMCKVLQTTRVRVLIIMIRKQTQCTVLTLFCSILNFYQSQLCAKHNNLYWTRSHQASHTFYL